MLLILKRWLKKMGLTSVGRSKKSISDLGRRQNVHASKAGTFAPEVLAVFQIHPTAVAPRSLVDLDREDRKAWVMKGPLFIESEETPEDQRSSPLSISTWITPPPA